MITIIGIIVSVIMELDCTVNEHRDFGGGGVQHYTIISRESFCHFQMRSLEPTCLGRWVNQIL